jgi:hypothetical protein
MIRKRTKALAVLFALIATDGFADYSGLTCVETIVAGVSEPLKSFVVRRVGGDANLNHGGVDWLKVNAEQNRIVDVDSVVRVGTKLQLMIPLIEGIAKRPRAVCESRPIPLSSPNTSSSVASLPGSSSSNSSFSNRSLSGPPSSGIAISEKTKAQAVMPVALNSSGGDRESAAYAGFIRMKERNVAERQSMSRERPTLSSNTGVRFGVPVGVDAVLLSKSQLLNAFVSVRGGALDGLTIFTDSVAPVAEDFEGQSFSLG